MIHLAWPFVALCYAVVLWSFLQAYLRGLRSEREGLAVSNDDFRKRLDQYEAHVGAATAVMAKQAERILALEDNTKALEQRVPGHVGTRR